MQHNQATNQRNKSPKYSISSGIDASFIHASMNSPHTQMTTEEKEEEEEDDEDNQTIP
jgi:hypothetical protein